MSRAQRIVLWVGVGLAGALVLLAVAPLVVPLPEQHDTVPPQQLADGDSRFVDVGGIQLHVKEAGPGPAAGGEVDGAVPLVLLHGFAASTYSWEQVMPQLAADRRVIAFDRPGFGLTERPLQGDWDPEAWPGGTPYSTEAQVEQTVQLLDRLGIEQAILVGHSAGGTVAAATALVHPERVKGLILVAPALTGDGPPSWLGRLLKLPQVRRLAPVLARSLRSQGERLVKRAWYDPDRVTPEVVAGYTLPTKADDWDKALVEIMTAPRVGSLEGRLGEIDVPTLVVTGDHDTWIAPEKSSRASQLIPGSRLEVIADSGHLPHEEQPAAFLDVVEEWLTEQAPK